jgi:hypothetical protein
MRTPMIQKNAKMQLIAFDVYIMRKYIDKKTLHDTSHVQSS